MRFCNSFKITYVSIVIFIILLSACGSQSVLAEGSLVAWGLNDHGQCDVPHGNDFIAVTAGGWASLALRSDGSLVAWGNNYDGQLNVPDGHDFIAIAMCEYGGLALRTNGSLFAWGRNVDGLCNVPAGNNFIAISAGIRHYLALRSDGTLAAWGSHEYGECQIPAGNNFRAIAGGDYFSLGIKSDYSIAVWGLVWPGQNNPPNGSFIAIAGGGDHALALKSDHSITAWGRNDDGRCNVPSGTNFIAIDGGWAHSLALRNDGSLIAWGKNSEHQCDVPSGNNFTAIAAGVYHCLAIRQMAPKTIYVDNDAANDPEPNNPLKSDPAEDGSAAHPFDAIQKAINHAEHNDLVIVSKGTYFENINSDGKNIILRSTGPDDPNTVSTTILNGNNANSVIRIMNANVTVEGFTITNGRAKSGGGIYCYNSSSIFSKCIITENEDISERNSNIDGGGGIFLNRSNAKIYHCEITKNRTTEGNIAGGGIFCMDGTVTIDRCKIVGNVANGVGGGVFCRGIYSGCDAIIMRSMIHENSALGGAGIYVCSANSMIVNCVISKNTASVGGGICFYAGGSSTIHNCTITGNQATACCTDWGGGIWSYTPCIKEVSNSIIWGNIPDDISPNDQTQIIWSDIGEEWFGVGNINKNPCFDQTVNDGFLLKAESPCINSGDPNIIIEPNETDLDGRPRILGGRVDMGAYEYSNAVPVANAGPDQTVYAWITGKAKLKLDGSDSNGPDGDALSYKWTWTVDANTYEANGVSSTIDLPVGVHTITLVVNDGFVDSAPDDVNVTVIAALRGTLKTTPQTINRKSNQPEIQACIELPGNITKNDVDLSEPLILSPGRIKATSQNILAAGNANQKFNRVTVSFDKTSLINAVPADGDIELKVAGKFKTGQYFFGADTIRIIH